MPKVSRTITAAAQYTDPLRVGGSKTIGYSIQATALSGTIVVQRRYQGETTWGTLETKTAVGDFNIESNGPWEYRIGCSAWTSGTDVKVLMAF